jgi:hypothetical protein
MDPNQNNQPTQTPTQPAPEAAPPTQTVVPPTTDQTPPTSPTQPPAAPQKAGMNKTVWIVVAAIVVLALLAFLLTK